MIATFAGVGVMLFRPMMMTSLIAVVALPTNGRSAAKPCARAQVSDLVARVSALSPQTRELCRAIYHVSARHSEVVIPPKFEPKMVRWTLHAGQTAAAALDAARAQTVVCVTDVVHGQTAHFNPLRASKPVAFKKAESTDGSGSSALDEIAASAGPGCDFCAPLEMTGEERWGRLRGSHSVTAANAFRADGAHGLLVFARHDPLAITLDELADGLEVIERWLVAAAAEAPRQRVDGDAPPAGDGMLWPTVWLNALHKSSASQIHAHAQMMLSPVPHGRTRLHARARAEFAEATRARGGGGVSGGGDFWADLSRVHTELGLGVRHGKAHVLASLTPHVPAGEILVIGDIGASLAELAAPIHAGLRALIDERGCKSYSLVFALEPFSTDAGGRSESAAGGRVIATLLDRGADLDARTADVGGIDLVIGSTISNSDPFDLARAIALASGEALAACGGLDGSSTY